MLAAASSYHQCLPTQPPLHVLPCNADGTVHNLKPVACKAPQWLSFPPVRPAAGKGLSFEAFFAACPACRVHPEAVWVLHCQPRPGHPPRQKRCQQAQQCCTSSRQWNSWYTQWYQQWHLLQQLSLMTECHICTWCHCSRCKAGETAPGYAISSWVAIIVDRLVPAAAVTLVCLNSPAWRSGVIQPAWQSSCS